MSGYTKLFNSILASTIWRADDKTRLVWITMLAMSDRNGVVETSIPGLADLARVSIPDCEAALQELSSPDTYSRSKEHEGRRIEAIDGGFHLVNHGKYREKMSKDERREYQKLKMREYRRKGLTRRKQALTEVDDVGRRLPELTHTAPEASPAPDPIPISINKPEREIRAVTTSAPKVSLSPAAPKSNGNGKHISGTLDPDIAERAGRFCDRYAEFYQKHRRGARYLPKPNLDWNKACELCAVWPDERLDMLATVFLKTDHSFAESGSRTIGQFAALASWCDDRLREVEAGA